MAELCKKCFLECWHPLDAAGIEKDIVLSEECEICEGCGDCVPYVHHIGNDISCEEYDELMNRVADEFAKIGCTSFQLTSEEIKVLLQKAAESEENERLNENKE